MTIDDVVCFHKSARKCEVLAKCAILGGLEADFRAGATIDWTNPCNNIQSILDFPTETGMADWIPNLSQRSAPRYLAIADHYRPRIELHRVGYLREFLRQVLAITVQRKHMGETGFQAVSESGL